MPTSLPQAFTSVWSVLRSGVRTDELADCVSRSNKQAAPYGGRSVQACSFCCRKTHRASTSRRMAFGSTCKFDPGPMVGMDPIYYLVARALGLADGGWLYQKTATSQIRWVRECWLKLFSAAVSKDVKDFLPSLTFLRRPNGLAGPGQCQMPQKLQRKSSTRREFQARGHCEASVVMHMF